LTFAEFNALVRGQIERERRQLENDLAHAWQIAAFIRAKRLPSLKSLLTPAVTKTLSPAEAARRKAEHADLAARVARMKKGTTST
jgi:hypothetical protein